MTALREGWPVGVGEWSVLALYGVVFAALGFLWGGIQ